MFEGAVPDALKKHLALNSNNTTQIYYGHKPGRDLSFHQADPLPSSLFSPEHPAF